MSSYLLSWPHCCPGIAGRGGLRSPACWVDWGCARRFRPNVDHGRCGLGRNGLSRAALEGRFDRGLSAASWRIWSLAGATTILSTYLLEYFPAHLGEWHLEVIHPLYGWSGLPQESYWPGRRCGPASRASAKLVDFAALMLATGFAAAPMLSWAGTRMFLARDLVALRLTNQPDGVVAANLWSWLARDGFTAAVCATLLPVVAIFPASWLLLRAGRKQEFRASLAIALMPVLVSIGIASGQLSWWNMVDGTFLVLIIVLTSRAPVLASWCPAMAGDDGPGVGCPLRDQPAPAPRTDQHGHEADLG